MTSTPLMMKAPTPPTNNPALSGSIYSLKDEQLILQDYPLTYFPLEILPKKLKWFFFWIFNFPHFYTCILFINILSTITFLYTYFTYFFFLFFLILLLSFAYSFFLHSYPFI
jgi:hypothetical protein